ncbi:MAG: nitrile hydratase accessory protein [Pseudomonadota bacterium]
MPPDAPPALPPIDTAAGESDPAFAAPWEAEAFALKAHLVATGKLDATRFAEVFSAALAEAPAPRDDGTAYFVAFVTALERALGELAPPADLVNEQAAWRAAAASTPHGEPIVLGPDRARNHPVER